jgi:hypothetical protein
MFLSMMKTNTPGIMKQKKIETHKIGLVGQAPSRRENCAESFGILEEQ